MLDNIRKRINDVDTELLDLLHKRLELVQQVAQWKENNIDDGKIFIKPHREAEVIRRVLAQNNGIYPESAIINIWRNIISASVNSEQALSICAFTPSNDETNYWLAREYFGNLCPIDTFDHADQVVQHVTEGTYGIGVLSIDAEEKWWSNMPDDIKIFAKIDKAFCIAKTDFDTETCEHFIYITDTPLPEANTLDCNQKDPGKYLIETREKTDLPSVGQYSNV